MKVITNSKTYTILERSLITNNANTFKDREMNRPNILINYIASEMVVFFFWF